MCIFLQWARMADDSVTMDDTKKGRLTEETDDSCTLEFIETVPLDTACDDCHTPEFVDPVLVISPEELQDVKEEAADENDSEGPNCVLKQEHTDEYEIESACFITQVRSVCSIGPRTCLHLPVHTKAKQESHAVAFFF